MKVEAGSCGLFSGAFSKGVRACSLKIRRLGQVTVELLLVLPIFMLMLFFIMEIGSLAYQTILAHHCAYELARIGSLVAGPNGSGSGGGVEYARMRATLRDMFPRVAGVTVSSRRRMTFMDPQGVGRKHMNEDLEVTLMYPAKLVFPGSSFFLSDRPRSRHTKRIIVTVRMPIEKPFFQ